MKSTLRASLVLLLAIAGLPAFAQEASQNEIPDDAAAQYYDTGPVESDVLVTLTPENPGAFQNVSVRLSSDYIDLARYRTVWIADGVTVADAIGVRSVTVRTKDYGQPVNVSVAIYLAQTTITRRFTLAPQDAALIWEASDAYAPAFYQGKKLPPREGQMTIAAIPNFQGAGRSSSTGPRDAVYSWKRNGYAIPGVSGYGNDAVVIRNSMTRGNEEIQVTATSKDNSSRAVTSVRVPTFSPFILFYQKNPATNLVSPLAKSSLYFTGESATVVAEPYHFSVPAGNPNRLTFAWTMDDAPISLSNSERKQSLVLENPGVAGSTRIGLSVKSPVTLFQSAARNLGVLWNEPSN